jgi:tetratricopeptide (TPR) repeat protein
MNHYTEDELSAYALRPEAVDDRPKFEQHMAACGDCREALDMIEAFDEALHDPLPWEMAGSMPAPHNVPRELIERARLIAGADAAARALLIPLVDSVIRFREARIADDPRFFTPSVIRLLCTVANGMHERQPQFGLVLADTALQIAEKLPESMRAKSSWHLGTAWKERANALRYLGRFKDAEEALDRAEEAFHAADYVEPFDLAIVAYVRATICAETERFDDAVRLAREAGSQFALYGDQRRYLSARMVEALGYYCVDRDAEAVPIFESVIAAARAAAEDGILGSALANAASCYTRLHAYDQAAKHYEQALSLFTQLDVPAERARIVWAFAAMKVESGDYEHGLPELERALALLRSFDLTNDVSLATLDLAAGLLAAGRPERVPALCRSVAVSFASEGMARSARKALAYLREAVSSGRATPEGVRHIRTYLQRLPARPRQEFLQVQ